MLVPVRIRAPGVVELFPRVVLPAAVAMLVQFSLTLLKKPLEFASLRHMELAVTVEAIGTVETATPAFVVALPRACIAPTVWIFARVTAPLDMVAFDTVPMSPV